MYFFIYLLRRLLHLCLNGFVLHVAVLQPSTTSITVLEWHDFSSWAQGSAPLHLAQNVQKYALWIPNIFSNIVVSTPLKSNVGGNIWMHIPTSSTCLKTTCEARRGRTHRPLDKAVRLDMDTQSQSPKQNKKSMGLYWKRSNAHSSQKPEILLRPLLFT